MASIDTTASNKSKGVGVKRSKKLSTNIDLTPMVDLGFLLITFFLFTTTLAKPKVMAVAIPAKPDPSEAPVVWSKATTTTILLSKDHQLYYYLGDGYDDASQASLKQTDFKGIRNVIMDRKKQVSDLVSRGEIKGNKQAAFLIKADKTSTYDDFVRILDEMNIQDVRMKAVVDITDQDRGLIASVQH